MPCVKTTVKSTKMEQFNSEPFTIVNKFTIVYSQLGRETVRCNKFKIQIEHRFVHSCEKFHTPIVKPSDTLSQEFFTVILTFTPHMQQNIGYK